MRDAVDTNQKKTLVTKMREFRLGLQARLAAEAAELESYGIDTSKFKKTTTPSPSPLLCRTCKQQAAQQS